MAEYVIMPKLGFNMDKGTLVRWIKKEGDFIKEQEVIFEIETDKTVMQVEAQTSGILRKILVAEGEEVTVTLPIAIIGDKDEDISKIIKEAYQKLGKTEIIEKEESKVDREVSPATEEKQEIELEEPKKEFKKISPGARRKAKELGVELQSLKGSGPGGVVIEKDVISYHQNHKGIKISPIAQKLAERARLNLETIKGTGVGARIMKKDVQEALAKTAEEDKVEERTPYTGMRKIIGDRLSQSKFTAPHIYLTTSVDMSEVIRLLKRFSQDTEKKVSINDFLIFVVAKVLSENPNINCSLAGEEIIYHKDINIGIAVALEEGLIIVPVLKNADKKNLLALSKEAKNLIQLSRERKLMPDDYKGGTFTVSNLGMYGIENFTAIINPPEVAILAVGTIKRVPTVTKEEGVEKIEVCSLMKVTLSVDHRLIDGIMAASFLKQLKYYLEFPENLIL